LKGVLLSLSWALIFAAVCVPLGIIVVIEGVLGLARLGRAVKGDGL
jgi:hypothetical protein